MKIWTRYLLREFAKIFFLVIISAYFLFVLIDYSAHAKNFVAAGSAKTMLYYLFQFAEQAELLISVSLLLATVKVLTTLNIRREFIALAAGGIPIRHLIMPFVFVALLAMLLLYANFQWFEPIARPRIETFEKLYFKGEKSTKTHVARLFDESLVFYHHYDFETKSLHDLFWVKDMDHIYHMQTFDPLLCLAQGVEYLERHDGLHRAKTYEKHFFPEVKFDPDSFLPKSLTKLIQRSKWDIDLFYKLTIPFIALFAVLGPAPFCLRFSKQTPTYLIYALSLFGLIAYFVIVNAAYIMGQSQTLSPALAMLLPLTIGILLTSYQCKKLC